MPHFSKLSTTRLLTCHIDLQTLFKEVIKHYDCSVLCGHRGENAQNYVHSIGNSYVTWPNSEHNKEPSLAVDVVPWYSERPHISWKDIKKFYHFAGFVLGTAKAMRISICWGGDWDSDVDLDDQSFMDLAHFEVKS